MRQHETDRHVRGRRDARDAETTGGISDEVVDEIARSIVEGWFQASQAWVTAEALESKLIEVTGKAQLLAVDEYAQLVMDYKRRHPEFQFTGDEYKTTNNTNKEDHAVEED